MLVEGKITEEIKKLCLEDNAFGASTVARANAHISNLVNMKVASKVYIVDLPA